MLLVAEARAELRGRVYVLDNGDAWEQTQPRLAELARAAAVRIWRAGALHWLEVAGSKALISVRRTFLLS